jgi:hemerythrin
MHTQVTTEPLEWNESYSVGARTMDREHQQLFLIMNMLIESVHSGETALECSKIIRKLYDYSLEHFKHEEYLLELKNYPQLEEQKEQHAIFLEAVFQLDQKVQAGTGNIREDLLRFLKVWWEDHSQKVDKNYAHLF